MLLEKAKQYEANHEYEKAYTLYMAATNIEECAAEAYYRIGYMHFEGNSYVEADQPKGCKYYEMAYERGFADFRPGDYLMMGSYRQSDVKEGMRYGLTKDLKLALEFYKLTLKTALDEGKQPEELEYVYSTIGQVLLEDEVQNFEMAYNFFMCSPHDIRSWYYLAEMYAFGKYVKQNLLKAAIILDQIVKSPPDVWAPDDMYREYAAKALEEIHENVKYEEGENKVVFIKDGVK